MAEYIEKDKIINLLEHNDKVYHYADRDKENIVYDTVQTLCRVIIEAEAADVYCPNCGADMRDVPDTDVAEIANVVEFRKRMSLDLTKG